jgi:hypothetical protein
MDCSPFYTAYQPPFVVPIPELPTLRALMLGDILVHTSVHKGPAMSAERIEILWGSFDPISAELVKAKRRLR